MSGHVRTSQGPQIHLGPQRVKMFKSSPLNNNELMFVVSTDFNEM